MASPVAFLLVHRITAEVPTDLTPPSQTTARVMVAEAGGVVSFHVMLFLLHPSLALRGSM